MKKKPPQKLWVVYTSGLQYDICALGKTKTEAMRAVYAEYKRTNHSGYGIPAYITSMKTFFDYYTFRFHKLAPGEAETE